jgi:hypothetical protein
MGQNKFTDLQTLRKQIAKLEKEVVKQQKKLLSLPGKYGFRTVGDFVAALKSAASAAGQTFEAARVKGTGKRAKITPEIKSQVKALVGEGKTGGEIAAKLGISVPSVANIKKELGLVKKRKG